MSKLSVEERFLAKIDRDNNTGCWVWNAGKLKGYGIFWDGGSRARAHRWSYEQAKGPIPEGLVIDHLCRNPSCVNPDHLEAVTDRVNVVERGTGITAKNAAKTHCNYGHEFTPENTALEGAGTKRACRKCRKARMRKYVTGEERT